MRTEQDFHYSAVEKPETEEIRLPNKGAKTPKKRWQIARVIRN